MERSSALYHVQRIHSMTRGLKVPIAWRHDERSKVRVVRDGTAMVLATRRIWRNARAVGAGARRGRAAEVFDEANAELLMREIGRAHV